MSEVTIAPSFEVIRSLDQAEVRRSYAEFFEVFGNPLLNDAGEVASRVLLPPRVLHFDADTVALHCLAIHSHVRRRTLSGHPRHAPTGEQTYQFMYNPRDFRVVTCDENGITDWKIIGALGTHHGPISPIDQQFDPAKIELELTLSHPSDEQRSMQQLQFWPTSQMGTMEVDSDRLGWILDEHSSRQRQAELLSMVASPLGYAAMAS